MVQLTPPIATLVIDWRTADARCGNIRLPNLPASDIWQVLSAGRRRPSSCGTIFANFVLGAGQMRSAEEGVKAVFNQILTRFHGILLHLDRKRGHHKRGLFVEGISRMVRFLFVSTVWLFSKFSRISRKWTSLKRPLFQLRDPFL